MRSQNFEINLRQSSDADILTALKPYTDLGLSTPSALKVLIRAGLVKSQIVDTLIAGLAERPASIDAHNAAIEAHNRAIDAHNDDVDDAGGAI